MNTYRRILRNADPGAGGGAPAGGTPGTPNLPSAGAPGGAPILNDFVKSLPADLQAEKSLHTIDSPVTLAKSYVHAQKLIGAKRLVVPDATSAESDWNAAYDALGRPKSADEYKVPEYKFEADPNLKLQPERVKTVQQALHKAGLNGKQFEAVMGLYMQTLDGDLKTAKQSQETNRATAETALKQEWGERYDVNLQLAKSVVMKFGDEQLNSYIAEGGGNDPRLMKFLAKTGAAMLEDKSRGGQAAEGMIVTDQTRATQEIDRLKLDNDFQKALRDKSHPSHKTAVQQWQNLFKVAHPGKQEER